MTQGIVTVTGAGSMPNTGRWDWYKDHTGKEFRRVSTLIKKVQTDTFNLELWKQRQVAIGLAARDDLVLAVKAVGAATAEGFTKEQKRTLNEIVKSAQEAAKARDGAKIGTAVHTLTERLDRGEALEQIVRGLPAVHGETVRAYAALRELNGWRNVEIERTVVCDELEVAGTLDRIDVVPGLASLLGPGTCQYGHAGHHDDGQTLAVVVDVKTEAEPWRNGLHIGPQLAIYSRARRMWLPAGEYVPAPCVRQDVAIVVHLRDGQAHPYFVNLTSGWEAAQAAYAQLKREQRAGQKLGAPGCWFVPVPNVVEPKPAQLLVEHAAAENYAGGSTSVRMCGPGILAPMDDALTAIANAYAPEVASQMMPVEHVAARGPDGLVRWTPAASAQFIATGNPPGVDPDTGGELDELRAKLIEQIWRTESIGGLGILWNMARDRGVAWTGPVEQAADARRRQIECVQRGMHSGTGRCACGWTPAVPA